MPFNIIYLMTLNSSKIVTFRSKIRGLSDEKTYEYRIQKFLGRGAFSQCYQVTNLQNKKRYALKKINGVKTDKNRFNNEVKILKTLKGDDSYVVKMIDQGTIQNENENMIIIFEYLRQGSLKDFLKFVRRDKKQQDINKGILEQWEILYLLLQSVKILRYIHQCNVIHRDIKPDNLMFDQEMRIKLIDFGLALYIEDEKPHYRTQSHLKSHHIYNISSKDSQQTYPTQQYHLKSYQICGSAHFIAPQVIQSVKGIPYSKQADIWSLGVVLYQIIFSKYPFDTQTFTNEARERLFKDISDRRLKVYIPNPNNHNYSAQLMKILESMLNKNPQYRITINQILQNELLKKIAANQSISKKFKSKYINYKRRKLISSSNPIIDKEQVIQPNLTPASNDQRLKYKVTAVYKSNSIKENNWFFQDQNGCITAYFQNGSIMRYSSSRLQYFHPKKGKKFFVEHKKIFDQFLNTNNKCITSYQFQTNQYIEKCFVSQLAMILVLGNYVIQIFFKNKENNFADYILIDAEIHNRVQCRQGQRIWDYNFMLDRIQNNPVLNNRLQFARACIKDFYQVDKINFQKYIAN